MPLVEKCLVCGLNLMFIPDSFLDRGGYYHVFSGDLSGYKVFHTPVPALSPDPSILGAVHGAFCGEKGISRNAEPRASVSPPGYISEKCACAFCTGEPSSIVWKF